MAKVLIKEESQVINKSIHPVFFRYRELDFLFFWNLYQQNGLLDCYIYERGRKMDNEKYLKDIANGDIDALGELYKSLKLPVYATALSITCDENLARDVLQETFVRVYDYIDTYKPNTRPKSWVTTIARNLSINLLKKRKREVQEVDMKKPIEKNNFNDSYEYDLTVKMDLFNLIFELDKIERQIIVYYHIVGLKHAEIAEILDSPPGTIRWKYREILKKLAKKLGGEKYAEK